MYLIFTYDITVNISESDSNILFNIYFNFDSDKSRNFMRLSMNSARYFSSFSFSFLVFVWMCVFLRAKANHRPKKSEEPRYTTQDNIGNP